MKIQMVIPYLNFQWCLEDMLESFGQSDIPILIVDNSPNHDLSQPKFTIPPNVTIQPTRHNIGVAASWNLGLRLEADQTVICSQWVRFAPSEIEQRPANWGLNHVARIMNENPNEWGYNFGDQGFHLISIGRKTVETIGYFDENFNPCFGEDDDFMFRMQLADPPIMMGGFPNWSALGIHSIAFSVHKRDGTVNIDTRALDYYSHKWCSVFKDYPGNFTRPFNNPSNPLAYWPEVRGGSGKNWNDVPTYEGGI
jgi:hypothetical protein